MWFPWTSSVLARRLSSVGPLVFLNRMTNYRVARLYSNRSSLWQTVVKHIENRTEVQRSGSLHAHPNFNGLDTESFFDALKSTRMRKKSGTSPDKDSFTYLHDCISSEELVLREGSGLLTIEHHFVYFRPSPTWRLTTKAGHEPPERIGVNFNSTISVSKVWCGLFPWAVSSVDRTCTIKICAKFLNCTSDTTQSVRGRGPSQFQMMIMKQFQLIAMLSSHSYQRTWWRLSLLFCF